jgi:hypothetical protein
MPVKSEIVRLEYHGFLIVGIRTDAKEVPT